jgi:hypothetical protein
MSELATSSGGDTDRRSITGPKRGNTLLATMNEPTNRLNDKLGAAYIPLSDRPVPELDGVAATGFAIARPSVSNADAAINRCISTPLRILMGQPLAIVGRGSRLVSSGTGASSPRNRHQFAF